MAVQNLISIIHRSYSWTVSTKQVKRKLKFDHISAGWQLRCVCSRYLQSNVAELATLSQSVHFGHGGIQETFVLKDQITVWNHLGEFKVFL